MIHRAKDLSPDQKLTIEALLGRAIQLEEAITIRSSSDAPAWLRQSWESAAKSGLDQITSSEIDAEINATRAARSTR